MRESDENPSSFGSQTLNRKDGALRSLVESAVLAPSGHNTQPWLFRISIDALELYADRTRALPIVDPNDRELIISCGAALFNVRAATRAAGFQYQLELLPDASKPDLLARLVLGSEGESNPAWISLMNAIPKRRTKRLPFDDRVVPDRLQRQWVEAVDEEGAWLAALECDAKHRIVDLIAEGDQIQMADRQFRRELAAWFRSNRSRRKDGIPGYAAGLGDLRSCVAPSAIRFLDMGAQQARRDRELALRSSLLLVLGTETDDALAWLRVGQALQRLLLQATTKGVHASFLNQPIEVPELRRRTAELCGRPGCPQLLIRLGYSATDSAPTPRRPAAEVILD